MDISPANSANYPINQPTKTVGSRRKTPAEKVVKRAEPDSLKIRAKKKTNHSAVASKQKKQKQANWLIPLASVVGGAMIIGGIVLWANKPAREWVVEHAPKWVKREQKPTKQKVEPIKTINPNPSSAPNKIVDNTPSNLSVDQSQNEEKNGSRFLAKLQNLATDGTTGSEAVTTQASVNLLSPLNTPNYGAIYEKKGNQWNVSKMVDGTRQTIIQDVPPCLHPEIKRESLPSLNFHLEEENLILTFDGAQEAINVSNFEGGPFSNYVILCEVQHLLDILDSYHEPYLGAAALSSNSATPYAKNYIEAFDLAKAHFFLYLLTPYSDELKASNIGKQQLAAARAAMDISDNLHLKEGADNMDDKKRFNPYYYIEQSKILDQLNEAIKKAEAQHKGIMNQLKRFVGLPEEVDHIDIPNL